MMIYAFMYPYSYGYSYSYQVSYSRTQDDVNFFRVQRRCSSPLDHQSCIAPTVAPAQDFERMYAKYQLVD